MEQFEDIPKNVGFKKNPWLYITIYLLNLSMVYPIFVPICPCPSLSWKVLSRKALNNVKWGGLITQSGQHRPDWPKSKPPRINSSGRDSSGQKRILTAINCTVLQNILKKRSNQSVKDKIDSVSPRQGSLGHSLVNDSSRQM